MAMRGGRGRGGSRRALAAGAIAAIAAAVAAGIVYVRVLDSRRRAPPARDEKRPREDELAAKPRTPAGPSAREAREATEETPVPVEEKPSPSQPPSASASRSASPPEQEPVLTPEPAAPVVRESARTEPPERKPAARRKPIPGLYGEAQRRPSRRIVSAVDKSVLKTRPWEGKKFFYVHTALHPGIFMRAKSDRMTLFHRLGEWGLGQPAFCAVRTADGARGFAGASFDGSKMTAPWIVASFAGSEGWTDWDAPWLIVMQKRPQSIERDADGLSVVFGGTDTGYVMAMPLYGYYKPPQKGREFLAAHGLPPVGGKGGIETWTWREGLPESVLRLVEFWAGTARAFPHTFEELFSADRLHDSITFKQRHSFLENHDEWGTEPVKFAAIPQTLALAVSGGTFPVEFSTPSGEPLRLTDPKCMTAYGPFMGAVLGPGDRGNEFTYTMRVLQYVNEKEKHKAPNMDDPFVAEASERLKREMSSKFREPDRPGPYDHGGMPNYCWCVMGDCWYAKALPYVERATAETVKSCLKRYFTDTVLTEKTYRPFRHKLQLLGPGIGAWGGWDDAGKFAMNTIHTIWCYGHYTGDWDLLKRRWDLILRLNVHPEEMHWAAVGRMTIAEMGDEAGPAIALARIAWKLGDVDQYNYACYVAAKELVHHYVKQVGHEYFRRRQPYHEMGFIPPEVFLTNMWGSTAGWQIDGRSWTYHGGEHQSNNRWVRFHSEDVGRFYRDSLLEEVRAELDGPDTGPGRFKEGDHWRKDDSHILPSFVRVRSLVLNERPAGLARWARPSEIGGPTSGVVASLVAYIRTGTEIEQERLIPASGEPSPFVPGRERETTGSLSSVTIDDRGGGREWPLPTWHIWKAPRYPAGAKSKTGFPFGHITPFPDMKPSEVETWPLDWAGKVTGMDAVEPRKIPNEGELRRRQSRIPFRIVGPFPNPGGRGLETVYAPERRIDLGASFPEAGGARWTPATSREGTVDLRAQLTPNEQVCAYAVTAVRVPTARKGILFIGSDDGVRVWLNGGLVHENAVRRGVKPDQDMVAVDFRRGWNPILMKIEQGDGGWGLYLRVAHPDGGPFEDVEFSADANVVESRSGK